MATMSDWAAPPAATPAAKPAVVTTPAVAAAPAGRGNPTMPWLTMVLVLVAIRVLWEVAED